MTDYERGHLDGQIAMRERAAAECYAESVRWQNETGEPQPAQALCAARILSLPIVGEADQRGAAATCNKRCYSVEERERCETCPSRLPQSVPHPNPGEQVPDSARIGSEPHVTTPARPGPSQECVSVPLPDFDSLANIASPSPCVAVDGYCVECGASLPLHGSCWKLAAVNEEHDAHR